MDPFGDQDLGLPSQRPNAPRTPSSTSRASVMLTDHGPQAGNVPAPSIRSVSTFNDPFADGDRNNSGYYTGYHEDESIPLRDA